MHYPLRGGAPQRRGLVLSNTLLYFTAKGGRINFLKENQLSQKFSSKWNVNKGEVEKHVMPMARYITEGIIDVLE